MKSLAVPITEKDISRQLDRSIQSPIYLASLKHLGIDQAAFIRRFSPLFEELPWDTYDPRRLQILLLQKCLPHAATAIQKIFRAYFIGELAPSALNQWTQQLNKEQQAAFDRIKPWRRRSVARFILTEEGGNIQIERSPVPQFVQALDENDYRSWPRRFEEAPTHHVENPAFNEWLKAIFQLTASVRPGISKLSMTAHFMSVQARHGKPGDNSPEGAHEDGADFIVSALVINRSNITGGESQVIEKRANGQKEIIFRRKLQVGEFIFQADTGEELIYGNDLWHHVTPFYLRDQQAGEAWRDIIGFDINILK